MKAPAFSLQDQDGTTVTLDSLKGKKVVLYFYPKADTPGCTTQACGMRDNIGAIKNAGAVVVGVSPDEVKDLKKFQQKYSLNFMLLADPTTRTAQSYGVWQQKQFMGRTYMGVVRTTFLIDENGDISKKYEKVNPETHADMILADIHGTKTAPDGHVVVKNLDDSRSIMPKAKGAAKTSAAKKPAQKVAPKKMVKKTKSVSKKTTTKKKATKKPAPSPVKKTVKKQAAKKAVKKTAGKKKK